jgi:hypothetical protein
MFERCCEKKLPSEFFRDVFIVMRCKQRSLCPSATSIVQGQYLENITYDGTDISSFYVENYTLDFIRQMILEIERLGCMYRIIFKDDKQKNQFCHGDVYPSQNFEEVIKDKEYSIGDIKQINVTWPYGCDIYERFYPSINNDDPDICKNKHLL